MNFNAHWDLLENGGFAVVAFALLCAVPKIGCNVSCALKLHGSSRVVFRDAALFWFMFQFFFVLTFVGFYVLAFGLVGGAMTLTYVFFSIVCLTFLAGVSTALLPVLLFWLGNPISRLIFAGALLLGSIMVLLPLQANLAIGFLILVFLASNLFQKILRQMAGYQDLEATTEYILMSGLSHE